MRDFMNAAREVGCADYTPTWLTSPEVLGKALLSQAKRYARFLEDLKPAIGHRKALESIAKSAGMPNWHTLQTLSQGLIDDFDPEFHWPRPESAAERCNKLIPALSLLSDAREACPPKAEEKHGMERFASRLAEHAQISVHQALDLAAKMNGSDSWDALLKRQPEDSKAPLYRFFVEEGVFGRGGRFVWSQACIGLVERQDALFQGYSDRKPAKQRECADLVARITTARPDFLEGLLAKAEILYRKTDVATYRAAGEIYADAIKQADAMIPKDFKGEISWLFTDNRFYHRLLYGHMMWHSVCGSLKKSIALARKQLKRNPSDNLGVRIELAALLCADGQYEAASKAATKMADAAYSDGQIALVRSMCSILNDQPAAGLSEFLRALFELPYLRDVVKDSFELNYSFDSPDKRLVLPDMGTVARQFSVVTLLHPSLLALYSRLLDQPEVFAEEARLGTLFRDERAQNRGKPGVAMTWRDEVTSTVNRLVTGLNSLV